MTEQGCVAQVREAQALIFEAAERMARLHEAVVRIVAHGDMPTKEATRMANKLFSEGVTSVIIAHGILTDVCAVAAGHESSEQAAARLRRQADAIERDRLRRQGPLASAVCEGPGVVRCWPRLVVDNTG